MKRFFYFKSGNVFVAKFNIEDVIYRSVEYGKCSDYRICEIDKAVSKAFIKFKEK